MIKKKTTLFFDHWANTIPVNYDDVSFMTSHMKADKDFPFVFSISTFSDALTGQQTENRVERKSNSLINKN